MPMDVTIHPIESGSDLLETLATEARAQGYAFVDRLIDEARSGQNAFQKAGECFCGVFVDGTLVGCGGLNQDPYVGPTVGRIRHIFILAAYRRRGIAAALVRELLRRAKPAFATVRLRTPDKNASRFYEALGFERTDHETATHLIKT